MTERFNIVIETKLREGTQGIYDTVCWLDDNETGKSVRVDNRGHALSQTEEAHELSLTAAKRQAREIIADEKAKSLVGRREIPYDGEVDDFG